MPAIPATSKQRFLTGSRPILTPKTVLPLFFAIGIVFAPIGGLLLYASAQVGRRASNGRLDPRPSSDDAVIQVQMIQLDYTTCFRDAPTGDLAPMPDKNVMAQFHSTGTSVSAVAAQWKRQNISVEFDNVPVPGGVQLCQLSFNIPEDMGPPVLFYYQLTNFYQNHRRYVNSFFDKQLRGNVVDADALNGSSCGPLILNGTGIPIYPCGLIANSIFNDTFSSPIQLNAPNSSADNGTDYVMTNNNIAWSSDRALYGNFPSSMNYSEVAPPPNWQLRYPNGYNDNNKPPPIGDDESFMVWMRTAALPTFSKLAQRNDTAPMTKGTYQVNIQHCEYA